MELKPEHKPKQESWLARSMRLTEARLGEKVKTVWRVEEWTNPYTDDDYYVGSKRVDYSDWFNTRAEAERYLAKVQVKPYSRNELKITSKSLYRKWIPAHWKETWV